jgi:1-acyl-sn-glycerol-3-phosphate acyltransferase
MNELVFKILRHSVGKYVESIANIESNLETTTGKEAANIIQDKSKGVLLTSNHKSMLETGILPLTIYDSTREQIRVGAGNNLFSGLTKKVIDYTTTFTVNRNSKFSSVKSMRENMTEEIISGKRVLIFPEGTRSRTGLINPYNSASFGIALDTNKDIPTYIVPVDVSFEEVGDIKRLDLLDSTKKYSFKPSDLLDWKDYNSRVFVRFGEPIEVNDFKDKVALKNYVESVEKNLVSITASNLVANAYLKAGSTSKIKLGSKINSLVDELQPHWNKFMATNNLNELMNRSAVNENSSRREIEFYSNQIQHYLRK